ncbi:response regulator [Scytonema sp. UIC 10036]|uniref:response regulator transcription factor n=1 Tax=Scytonema sp. UIC 10036 TaxID=2304196 RepID=UPI0012DAAE8C|nr:response regulator [Scytonema sp. UIC 10036]MUG97840.1 response regulator [Scytonema sp. UIC 10036]
MTKILVIEDEAQSREMFLECLETEGFNVIGAENGVVGVQQAREHLPDLVICDIIMPELDGYGVLNTLRQNPVTAVIPFIFLTAKGGKAELRQGMKLGADDYLTKPSTVEDVLEAISIRLEKQTALKQWYASLHQINVASELEPTTKVVEKESIFPPCPHLNEVFQFIEANYQQPISLCDVAQAVGYAPSYLTDLMRRLTGQTINRWIVERRMAAARSLLLETNQSVEQIAEVVGYQNTGHFFRQFRKYIGTTPQAWRNSNRTQSHSH